MLFDIRGYDPDKNVNRVGDSFDYAADVEILDAAEAMLDRVKADAKRIDAIVPGEFGAVDSMARLAAEYKLAEINATILAGVVAQTEIALASYPADVVAYAIDRFPFLADA